MTMHCLFLRRVWVLALLAPLPWGCGGKVIFDENAGGSGGTGSTATKSSSQSTSKASSATSTGTGGSCPANPAIQGVCTSEGLTCPVPLACCGSNAICTKGHWVIEPNKCNQACTPCSGDFECVAQPGVICVDLQKDSSESFECRKDLCDGSTSCGCDQPICQEDGLQCASHAPLLLVCDCPNC